MSEDEIRREFKSGDLAYIEAVDRLCRLGVQPLDAEEQVLQWEREK